MRRSCSRSFTVALLVVATSTARLTTQDTTAGSAVTIVLDLPSPVVDKESIHYDQQVRVRPANNTMPGQSLAGSSSGA
jgi:hypothetical protein